jgi:hypothetical protein
MPETGFLKALIFGNKKIFAFYQSKNIDSCDKRTTNTFHKYSPIHLNDFSTTNFLKTLNDFTDFFPCHFANSF